MHLRGIRLTCISSSKRSGIYVFSLSNWVAGGFYLWIFYWFQSRVHHRPEFIYYFYIFVSKKKWVGGGGRIGFSRSINNGFPRFASAFVITPVEQNRHDYISHDRFGTGSLVTKAFFYLFICPPHPLLPPLLLSPRALSGDKRYPHFHFPFPFPFLFPSPPPFNRFARFFLDFFFLFFCFLSFSRTFHSHQQ